MNNTELTQIIENCEGLINKIISKYTKYYEYEDLYQVAALGIIKAYENYIPEYQTKFTTYAYNYILGEVIKYVNDNKGLKISNDYVILGRKILEAETILTQTLSKKPSTRELSLYLEIDERLINEAIYANYQLESLDREICEDGKTLFLKDTIVDSNYNPEAINNRIMLNQAIDSLPTQEKAIIQMRYFEDKSQAETAKALGVNQSQISRGLKKTLKKLKNNAQIAA